MKNILIAEAKDTHDKLREILIKYNSPEYGDAIVDEISSLFNFPTTIDIEPEEEEKEIEVQGLFVEIGSVPASYFSTGLLKLNDKEEIVVDKNNMTSQKGIFAAGDVTNIPYKQIIIAAGEGAKAALSVYEYLNNK